MSLTVVDADPDGFSASLVRTTLVRTTLGQAVPGTLVNVEVDLFARYLVDQAATGLPGCRRGAPMSARAPAVRVMSDAANPTAAAVHAMRTGRPVVVLDPPEREGEGDLVIAADLATPERLAFAMREARGLLCVAMDGARLDALETGRPVIFGVLTTNTLEQAWDRADGRCRRGVDAARDAVEMARRLRSIADAAPLGLPVRSASSDDQTDQAPRGPGRT